uniref:C-type lectin domain-containing protein n=2 Tax=Bactrocera dorsalis TaxID=27457 RepID=A0A034WJR1_BACDO
MKTKVKCVRRRSDNEFLRSTNMASHTNDDCAVVTNIKRFRLQSIAKWLVVVIVVNLANLALCNATTTDVKISPSIKYSNDSLSVLASTGVSLGNASPLVWSEFLEDYVLSQSSPSARTSKDLPFIPSQNDMSMMNPNMPNGGPGPLSYHSSLYKRPNVYITKRIGEAVELEPHMRPPVHVVNPQFRPMTNQMIQQQQLQEQQQRQQPGFFQQLFGLGGGGSSQSQSPPTQPPPPVRPVPVQQHHIQSVQHNGAQPPFRAVTENDLYLLGAIEKLVYRVDYLESRIRRAEQLIYYLMAGNNQKEVRDPCPTNFTRISDNCYYINSNQQVNWKTANSACKALNSHLAEFERGSENEEIMAHLLNQPQHRGRDYWLGGLNPGLLWIWSNSAKPVNPNMNLTSIAMSHANNTESNTIDVDGGDKDKKKKDEDDPSLNETILNNTVEIEGQGRCLRLSYNPTKHIYNYYGQECTSRHYYICEAEDKTLDNKIKKISRELKLFD